MYQQLPKLIAGISLIASKELVLETLAVIFDFLINL